MKSCIYEGEVRHRRMRPAAHSFRYRLCMLYLDLGELDHVFEGTRLWTVDGRGIANFRRRDHLGDTSVPLDAAVRELVAAQCGRTLAGPIRLLTHPAYWGFRFNPVSFYYCFSDDGRDVETIVAEVNNTPWKQQHCYVLDASQGVVASNGYRHRFAKAFHVSPFMDMDHQYDWRLSAPGDRLSVHMENFEHGERLFDATMVMRRREISPSALRRLLVRYPLMSVRVVAAIYMQATRLWLKRVPFFAHPETRSGMARGSA